MNEEQQLRTEILDKVRAYGQLRSASAPFVPGKDLVHYAGRVYDDEEFVALVDSSLDFYLTAGRYAEELEGELADYFDTGNAVLTNSGSSANLLAVSALTSPKLGDRRLRPGDEVLTVAAGFPSTVAPLVQYGLVPVFIDVGLGDYNVLAERLEQAVSGKTRAVMMAHTMGNPFNLDAVMKVVQQHDLWLIEDNCDALGSRYHDQLTGTFGHIATVSFYPAHHITMGEGGLVIADDEQLGRIVRSFRDWGRDCYCAGGENNTCGKRFTQQFGKLPAGFDHKYVYTHIGYNLKVTDMQAAVGLAQLAKLDDFITARKRNFVQLHEALESYQEHLLLPFATEHADPSWFGFVITVRPEAPFARADLVGFLEDHKIETRPLFAGNLLRHPAFMDIDHRTVDSLTNTDMITENTFFLGVYPGLDTQRIHYMAEQFASFFDSI